jgi:hypothetical protein
MSKYEILTLYGLRELLQVNNDLYSPQGQRMIVVNNGVLGGQLFYDHISEKVYGLCLKEIPITEKDKTWLEGEYAQEQIKYNMNYQEAIDYLKSKGKWSKS